MSTSFRKFPYNRIMKTYLSNLKQLRISKNLSQKELAKILNTSNSSVCDWECGRAQPDIETLIEMSKYFDVSVDYLLGLEN